MGSIHQVDLAQCIFLSTVQNFFLHPVRVKLTRMEATLAAEIRASVKFLAGYDHKSAVKSISSA